LFDFVFVVWFMGYSVIGDVLDVVVSLYGYRLLSKVLCFFGVIVDWLVEYFGSL